MVCICLPSANGAYFPVAASMRRIATSFSGAPEALAEAIIKLHDHPEETKRMGAAARRMAHERFDARKNAGQMLSLYKRLRGARSGECRAGAGA